MIPEFPTLKEMCMRKVLFEDLSREDLPYPMDKMLEGLDRLPGNYTVTQSSLEVIKDKVKERRALSENDEKHLSKLYKVEKGSKIEITKVMSGDPPFLWKINFRGGTGLRLGNIPIFGQPVYQCNANIRATSFIGGGEMEEGAEVEKYYTGKVEWKMKCPTCCQRIVCLEVDSKGKLDVTLKELKKVEVRTSAGIFEDNLEVIKTLVAQRD